MRKHEIIENHLELVRGLLNSKHDSLLIYLIEMAILENGRRTGLTATGCALENTNPRTPEPLRELLETTDVT